MVHGGPEIVPEVGFSGEKTGPCIAGSTWAGYWCNWFDVRRFDFLDFNGFGNRARCRMTVYSGNRRCFPDLCISD